MPTAPTRGRRRSAPRPPRARRDNRRKSARPPLGRGDDGDPHDGSDQGTQGKSHHQWERRGTHPCSPDRQEPTMPLPLENARPLLDRRRHAWLAADVVSYLDCWVDDLVLETPGRVIRGRADYE